MCRAVPEGPSAARPSLCGGGCSLSWLLAFRLMSMRKGRIRARDGEFPPSSPCLFRPFALSLPSERNDEQSPTGAVRAPCRPFARLAVDAPCRQPAPSPPWPCAVRGRGFMWRGGRGGWPPLPSLRPPQCVGPCALRRPHAFCPSVGAARARCGLRGCRPHVAGAVGRVCGLVFPLPDGAPPAWDVAFRGPAAPGRVRVGRLAGSACCLLMPYA